MAMAHQSDYLAKTYKNLYKMVYLQEYAQIVFLPRIYRAIAMRFVVVR